MRRTGRAQKERHSLPYHAQGEGWREETRTFGTMTPDLLTLADWLREAGVTQVTMESTGVYWKPIYNLLESEFNIILVNAKHIK